MVVTRAQTIRRCGYARVFQMDRVQSAGLEPFTLPVWLVMDDPGQDPGAWLHVYSVLTRRIRGGEYPAGARLPTETELADEFGCGPGTAARALRALQRGGLARKVPSRGYVSSGPDAHPG